MSGPAPRIQLYPGALPPGTQVGRWRVLEPLGTGGAGAVYRVDSLDGSCEPCALKLALRPGDARAARELILLRGAEHPNIVRVLDWGHWPNDSGYLFLVMEQVRGLPLHTWVEETNPSLRELVAVSCTVALTLDWLHSRGVLHRDLKPEHILVRAEDRQPVLIDFNAADFEGAPTLTTAVLPPGTMHLLSPEAVDFHRLHYGKPGVRYTFGPMDDLYALGVCLFRALTGHYPFAPHLPADLLALSILTELPPQVGDFNRRVPKALSQVVARLLEKTPESRYASGRELHEALTAAVLGPAELWEERVFAWDGATEDAGAGARKIVRPEWPTRPTWPPLSLRKPLPLQHTSASSRLSRLTRPATQAATNSRVPRGRRILPAMVMGAASVLIAGAVLLLVLKGPHTPQSGASSSAQQPVVPLHESPRMGGPGWEVAPFVGTPDSLPAALLPHEALAPAEAAPATEHGKDTVDVKAPPSSSPTSSSKRPGRSTTMKQAVGAATAICMGLSCSSAPVRPAWPPPPPPADCPPGAVQTMEKEFGIRLPESVAYGHFWGETGKPRYISVREGPASFRLTVPYRKLPAGTELSGQLYFSDRIYGRITSARTPQGQRYPVCMELLDTDNPRGLLREGEAAEPGAARVFWLVLFEAVSRFE